MPPVIARRFSDGIPCRNSLASAMTGRAGAPLLRGYLGGPQCRIEINFMMVTLTGMNFVRAGLLVLTLLCSRGILRAQSDWDEPFPAHRIADNLYYVGSKGLASYLVTTTNGHILINSSFERTVPMIRTNVESLGFKFTDIKVLLASHAHSDHVAGHALVKKLTGARVEVMEGDAAVITGGGKGQYLYSEGWPPCPVDHVLHDGGTVTLGGITLTARLTPGHTRGCTTWLMTTTDAGKKLNVVIIGSPNINPGYALITNRDYPEIADDYAQTFRLLKSLPCDIFLGAHGNYYGMEAKYEKLKANPKTNPFIDPAGYQAYVSERAQNFTNTLEKQKQ